MHGRWYVKHSEKERDRQIKRPNEREEMGKRRKGKTEKDKD